MKAKFVLSFRSSTAVTKYLPFRDSHREARKRKTYAESRLIFTRLHYLLKVSHFRLNPVSLALLLTSATPIARRSRFLVNNKSRLVLTKCSSISPQFKALGTTLFPLLCWCRWFAIRMHRLQRGSSKKKLESKRCPCPRRAPLKCIFCSYCWF